VNNSRPTRNAQEGRLLEVMIARKRFRDSKLAHDHKAAGINE